MTPKDASPVSPAPAARPRVYLNHLLIFVDKAAYDEIARSLFLRDAFAWFEERTTIDAANAARWTGCYLYGAHTYFEFMNPEDTSWAHRDGVAFGVDTPEAGRTVQANLQRRSNIRVDCHLRSRRYEDRETPWFYMIQRPHDDDEAIATWIMEYHPDFLRTWAPELPPHTGGIGRHHILTRYKTRLAGHEDPSERLFKDIVSVRLTLPERDRNRLVEDMKVYGYAVSRKGDAVVCQGPDIAIVIEPGAPQDAGIRRFTMTLNHAYSGPDAYRFGDRYALAFPDDRTAEWRVMAIAE